MGQRRDSKARQKEDGGVLLSGNLTLIVGGVVLDLRPGDSFQFTRKDDAWRNAGDQDAVVIWIVSPPIY